MDLQFWPGAVVMMLIAALTAPPRDQWRALDVESVLALMAYLNFAMTL